MTLDTVEVKLQGELAISPNSKYALVTVCSGDHAVSCLSITRRRMEDYATKLGMDFICLEGNHIIEYPMFNKFRMYTLFCYYEGILFVDSDVIIAADAPSILEAHGNEKLLIFDELADTVNSGAYGWVQYESDLVAISQGIPIVQMTWSGNGGVFYLPRSLSHLYRPPEKPIVRAWCSDQQLLSVRAISEPDTYTLIDYKWNCIYNCPSFWTRLDESFFIHGNSLNGDSRIQFLRHMDKYKC
jgi:hypothetical protein